MLIVKIYLKFINIFNFFSKKTSFFFLKISDYRKFSHKNLIFLREGMLVDCLQKLSVDKLIKKLYIQSMQFFNLNYYNYKLIRFILDEIYSLVGFLFNKGDDLNYSNVLWNILLAVLWIFQIIIILFLNFFFFLA